MAMPQYARWLLATFVTTVTSGCVNSPVANQPIVTGRLQMISAGYTGCQPEDNLISNTVGHLNGSQLWNATCKGKVYLCSGVDTAAHSCAPVAQ
jgi:hypothetical protein